MDLNFSQIETTLKVVVVGDLKVGKSTIIQRFCNRRFSSAIKPTIGE